MRKKKNWRKPGKVEESIPVSIQEEDLDFLNEYKNYAKFLLSTGDLEEIEDNYSKGPQKEYRELLPIKLKDGSLKRQSMELLDSDFEASPNIEPSPDLTNETLAADTGADATKGIEGSDGASKSRSQQKEEIALLATEIIQDPQKNIVNLEKLREFTKSKKIEIVKLALLSLLMVFKDIIPGYRIRVQDTDQVSKEVKKLRNFENSLLENYQEYLKDLEALSSDKNYKKTGAQCLTELLKTVSHFNFRNNLLNVVIGFMYSTDKEISVLCCDCISYIFKGDVSGEISLEATKIMSKMIKSRGYKVPEQMISTFLDLRLIEEFSKETPTDLEENKTNKKRKLEHISRKSKKVLKVNQEIEKELKEAEAVYDKDEKRKIVIILKLKN